MKKNKYEIRNQAGSDTAELLLYGIIGDYWDELDAKDIVEDLRGLDVKNITVRIYSDGGSVFAGLAIYNALKNHPAQILIVIDSLAASIASVIAMAGTVEMPENAFMMIHNPWGGACGEASDMEKMAEILAKIKTSLVGVYEQKTGLAADKLSTMMDDETWLTAQEAVDLGFADRVAGQADVKNFKKVFNQLTNYKNVPDRLRELVKNNNFQSVPAGDKGSQDMITLELIKNEHPDIAKALMAEGAAAANEGQIQIGAETERARIQAVAAQSIPGHEALIQGMMFDGKSTGGDAAMAVVGAEKQLRVNAQTNLAGDTIQPVNTVVPKDPPPPKKKADGILTEDQFKADADLMAEFDGDFTSYEAFAKADEKGLIRMRGGKE